MSIEKNLTGDRTGSIERGLEDKVKDSPEKVKEIPYQIDDYVKLAKGTYIVDKEIKISETGTLDIEPGTKFLFKEKAGIRCEGVLKAEGTEEDVIEFSAHKDKWKNIYLEGNISSSSILKYCKISRGSGRSISGKNYGGGIFLNNSNPTIQHVIIENCSAANGGGIYLTGSNPELSYNIIKENTAQWKGGGISLNESNPKMYNNDIIENHSNYNGGGIWLHESVPVMIENTIKGNTSEWSGGGMYISRSNPIMNDNTVRGNTSTFDGGVHLVDSNPNLANNTIIKNKQTST